LAHLAGFGDLGILVAVVFVTIAFLVLHFRTVASDIPDSWQRWKITPQKTLRSTPRSDPKDQEK
jgi:hypothetical protein